MYLAIRFVLYCTNKPKYLCRYMCLVPTLSSLDALPPSPSPLPPLQLLYVFTIRVKVLTCPHDLCAGIVV